MWMYILSNESPLPLHPTTYRQNVSLCVEVLEHMPLGPCENSDLSRRIGLWQESVFKSTLQQVSTGQLRSQRYEPHHMKLRSRDTRPALAKISGNPYSKKRKASTTTVDGPSKKGGKKAVMDKGVEELVQRPTRGRPRNKNQQYDRDKDEHQDQPVARRPPGRPSKNSEPVISHEATMPFRPTFPPPETPRRGSISPSKGGRSPVKKGQLTIYQPVSEAAIDMEYLRRCDPAVQLTDFQQLKEERKDAPPPVNALFKKLQYIPSGPIPLALEVFFIHSITRVR